MRPKVLWIEFYDLPQGHCCVLETPKEELRLACPTNIILRVLGVEAFGRRHGVEDLLVLSTFDQDLHQCQITVCVIWFQLDPTLGFHRCRGELLEVPAGAS